MKVVKFRRKSISTEEWQALNREIQDIWGKFVGHVGHYLETFKWLSVDEIFEALKKYDIQFPETKSRESEDRDYLVSCLILLVEYEFAFMKVFERKD